MTILSAYDYQTFDSCERRFAIARDWEPPNISATALLYQALDDALLAADPEEEAKTSALRVVGRRDIVASPHLDTYTLATHVGWLAGILAFVLRHKLGTLKRPANVPFLDGYWRSGLFEDESQELHRIALVSHWDDDRLLTEAHSWATIGELAAMHRPLTLHAVVIGPNRKGRRHSPWAKGYHQPRFNHLRFKRRPDKTGPYGDGSRLRGKGAGFDQTWLEVWREKMPEITTAKWFSIMQADDVVKELIISRRVELSENDPRLNAARKEMEWLALDMKAAQIEDPMRRSSCDDAVRGPCPFQRLCYSREPMTVRQMLDSGHWGYRRGEGQSQESWVLRTPAQAQIQVPLEAIQIERELLA